MNIRIGQIVLYREHGYDRPMMILEIGDNKDKAFPNVSGVLFKLTRTILSENMTEALDVENRSEKHPTLGTWEHGTYRTYEQDEGDKNNGIRPMGQPAQQP